MQVRRQIAELWPTRVGFYQLEGEEAAVREYLGRVRALKWQALQVRVWFGWGVYAGASPV